METVTLEATKHYYNPGMVVNRKFEVVHHPAVGIGGRASVDTPGPPARAEFAARVYSFRWCYSAGIALVSPFLRHRCRVATK